MLLILDPHTESHRGHRPLEKKISDNTDWGTHISRGMCQKKSGNKYWSEWVEPAFLQTVGFSLIDIVLYDPGRLSKNNTLQMEAAIFVNQGSLLELLRASAV